MTKSVSFAPDDKLVETRIYNLCPDLSVRKDGLDPSTIDVIRWEAKLRAMGNYVETMDIMRVCIYKPYRDVYFEAEAKALSLSDPCYFVIGSMWLRIAGRDPRPEETEDDTEVETEEDTDWVDVDYYAIRSEESTSPSDLANLLRGSDKESLESDWVNVDHCEIVEADNVSKLGRAKFLRIPYYSKLKAMLA